LGELRLKNSILNNNIMDDNQRLHLQKMIAVNNVEDQTGLIRELKHSHILRDNVNNLVMLKAKYFDEPEALHLEAMAECNFLFTYYTDLYNKIRKDEIDLKILFQFIDVLRKIEDGEMDQHEGSFEVGLLLKKIYVDSALRKAEKLNAVTGVVEPEYKGPQVDISWKQYKMLNKG
jgi:hypothetical protein